MAVDNVLLTRRSVLLAAVETTTGTAESLDAANGAFIVHDFDIEPDQPTDERPKAGGLGHHPESPGPRSGTATFSVDPIINLSSGTTSPAWASVFLPACGMAEAAGVWTFDSTVQKTLTIAKLEDGLRKQIVGGAGTFSITLNPGRAPRIQFEFQGAYSDVADSALVSPTFPSGMPPRFAQSGAFTVDGNALRASAVEIDVANQIVVRPDPNSASGYRAGVITGRKPVATIDPEMKLVAGYDWHAAYRNASLLAFSAAIGATANNILTFDSAAAQVTAHNTGDREGIKTDALTLLFTDDDLSLTFS